MEDEIDKVVAELPGITDEELQGVKKTLGVLKGEGVARIHPKSQRKLR